jgi:hypothetical protein
MNGAGVSPLVTGGIKAPIPKRKKTRNILMEIFGRMVRVFIGSLA